MRDKPVYLSLLKKCEVCGNKKPMTSFARTETIVTDECRRCRDKRKGLKKTYSRIA